MNELLVSLDSIKPDEIKHNGIVEIVKNNNRIVLQYEKNSDFIDLVKAQGGFCFAAHPFRNNNRGLEENLRTVKGLDGLEVLNGSTSVEACQKAARYAQELGLCTMGSSDCHVPEKVGACATWFPEEVKTMEEFMQALKKGGMKPAYYEDGAYHILEVQEYGNGYPKVGF